MLRNYCVAGSASFFRLSTSELNRSLKYLALPEPTIFASVRRPCCVLTNTSVRKDSMDGLVHRQNVLHYKILTAESEFDPSHDEDRHAMLVKIAGGRNGQRQRARLVGTNVFHAT